ncbi:MAG: MFS transporter [Planctomycetaceae bacterium]|nr:MFS transporter [Planctomycetaceae bacterium]
MTAPQKLTGVQWLVCTIAAIGFAFDIYELLMLPLILKPAIASLSAPLIEAAVTAGAARPAEMAKWLPGGENYTFWARTLFFVPAVAGGLFGLFGGWLTDRLGRRRVLTFSILLYAFGAMAAGFATNLQTLLVFRCCVFIGVCVEFVAAVAWLAELFPNHEQREKVLGWTQAFSSFGGLMVAGMNILAGKIALSLPEIQGGHEAWRYTLISGVIPALPLLLIRPFLPESPEWQKKKESGQLRRPSIGELFSPALRKTTIMTTLVFAASYGIAFGAIQQLPQILGAQALGTPKESGHKQVIAAAKAKAGEPKGKNKETGKPEYAPDQKKAAGNESDAVVAGVTLWQELGGLVGRALLAVMALKIASRRNLLRLFQIPSMIFVPALFFWISTAMQSDSLTMIKVGVFIAGVLTVSQFSFWGNYIPLVFPVHLRGTGESFAANIGGRILGTAAAFITISLAGPGQMAIVGACVAGAYALVGAILTGFLPEPGTSSEPH